MQALSTSFGHKFITLSLCLQHVCHDAACHMGLSATAGTYCVKHYFVIWTLSPLFHTLCFLLNFAVEYCNAKTKMHTLLQH